jgi:hypothetical protein
MATDLLDKCVGDRTVPTGLLATDENPVFVTKLMEVVVRRRGTQAAGFKSGENLALVFGCVRFDRIPR